MNKVTRNKSSKYTTISNVFLRDKNLSVKAKGFLAVVMGLPEDWDFSIKGICSILKEGKSAVYNIIQELKEYGYCTTQENRNEKGLYLGVDYTFYEEPYADIPQQEYPHPENQYPDNTPQLNTKEIKTETIKERDNKENYKKKNKIFDVRDDLSYVDAEYVDIWNNWLDYKDEIKNQYKTQRGAIMQFKSLLNYANNNPQLADVIVRRSIEQSWIGLFPMDEKTQKQYLNNGKNLQNDNSKQQQNLTLSDGTFYIDGHRYYHSTRDEKDYSLPYKAGPRPGSDYEYLDKRGGWYNPDEIEEDYGGIF